MSTTATQVARDDVMRGFDGLTLGERIRRLRRAAGRKQIEIAFSAEVNVFAWSRWENDQVAPTFFHAAAIADVLNVSLDFLYWGMEIDRSAATPAARPAGGES